MRSKTFCLLVCLTSCVIYASNQNDKFFCESGYAVNGREDCHDKTAIDAADFAWNLETAFNNRKEVPKIVEYVEIDLHRALYIEADVGKVLSVKLGTSNPAQCKKFLTINGDRPKVIEDDIKVIDIPSTTPIFTHTISVSAGTFAIIVVFDPECRLYVKLSDITYQNKPETPNKLHHIFSRNIKTVDISKEILNKEKPVGQSCDDECARNQERGLGHFIVSETHSPVERNLKKAHFSPNLFFNYSIYSYFGNGGGPVQCYHQCQYGKLFEFEFKYKGTNFANTFKLKKQCEWMTIHFNGDEPERATEISLRHGFVRLPAELKAHPIEFETSGDLKSVKVDKTYYEVLFTYFSELDDRSNTYVHNIIVANRHGRAVRALNTNGMTKKLKIAFSDDNCLASVIGSEIKYDVDDPLKAIGMKDYEFDENRNLGHLVANNDGYKVFRYADNPTVDPTDEYKIIKKAFGLDATEDPTLDGRIDATVIENDAATTTTEPDMYTGTVPTMPPVPPHEYSEEEQREYEEKVKKHQVETEAKQRTLNGADKRYRTWAIPAGFAAGSIMSFVIANLIMFVFRRSVLTFWFKAMYKRYGSDTTMGAGTTMGKTGAGETVGGSTTVGGGTTMGGTTAGETVGSTTAA